MKSQRTQGRLIRPTLCAVKNGDTVNEFKLLEIPPHVLALVTELEQWIKAATASGVSDADAERYSALEQAISMQLQVLGWSAVLNGETSRWTPIPDGNTIVSNLPDPCFYPQRRYQVPEGPAQWRTIWDADREVRCTTWREAYAFVFTHLAQEQEQLPRKRFCVRPPNTWGGDDYVATSAGQALQLHLNYWLAHGWVTAEQAVTLPLHVFEHCGDRNFYCRACQHAPCKYTPGEQWPLPAAPGWIGSSL